MNDRLDRSAPISMTGGLVNKAKAGCPMREFKSKYNIPSILVDAGQSVQAKLWARLTARFHRLSEHLIKRLAEGEVQVMHCDRQAQIYQTCDTMVTDATGDDPFKVAEVRFDIYADPMKTHPSAQSDTDRSDFIFCRQPIAYT